MSRLSAVLLVPPRWRGLGPVTEAERVLVVGGYDVRMVSSRREFASALREARCGVVFGWRTISHVLESGAVLEVHPPLVLIRKLGSEPDTGLAEEVYAELDVDEVSLQLLRTVSKAVIEEILKELRRMVAIHPLWAKYPDVRQALKLVLTRHFRSLESLAREVGCASSLLGRRWREARQELARISEGEAMLPGLKQLLSAICCLRALILWLEHPWLRRSWSLIAKELDVSYDTVRNLLGRYADTNPSELTLEEIPALVVRLEGELRSSLGAGPWPTPEGA